MISFQSIFWNLGFERLMHSSALAVSAETKDDALTENEYMQKKTEDRRFQGNQSLAHGNILFERYVFESLRVVLFFTHSREAPSLVGRLSDTGLPARLRSAQIKLWDTVFDFVMGYVEKGKWTSGDHTLFKVTHALSHHSKMFIF